MMKEGREYFEKQEKDVSNKYMSANGEGEETKVAGVPPTRPGQKSPYNLFTQQYFIGIGVGMLLGYYLLPKLLKRK